MRKSLHKRKEILKRSKKGGSLFKDFILGGQDGLVNVLGLILGLSIATNNIKTVIIAALAAMFAESISMGAVAYTSSKAEADYYQSQRNKEKQEIINVPLLEKEEVYDIYHKKGFRGKLLDDIVKKVVSDKKMWLDIMMKEEIGVSEESTHPFKSAFVVFLAAIIGSMIPLIPFFMFPIFTAATISLIVSAIALFVTGAIEARLTVGNWIKKGLELMTIGLLAAFIGFIVGKVFGG